MARIYRVRKSWSDSKTQIGAFSVLANAKKMADAHPGYKVYGDGGKLIYPIYVHPVQKNTTMSIATSYAKAMQPVVNACKAEITNEAKSKYKWQSNPTIAKAKKYATCVTFVACVLQRLGILKSGQYVWQNGKGTGKGKVYGNNSLMTVTYYKRVLPSSIHTKMKIGDIVMHDNTKSGHIQFYTGTYKDGLCKYMTGGTKHSMASWDKRRVRAIVRLKTFKITNECVNGKFTAGEALVLAKQNVTFRYTPNSGKKLKSVIIDGKAVDIKKYPTAYTFKGVTGNHSIKVVYA